MATFTKDHFRWPEFLTKLQGPEGCHFRIDDTGKTVWTCGGGSDKSKALAILDTMGIQHHPDTTIAYFEHHGGQCDCEIVFNLG